MAANKLLAAALAYAARGWHVFPCHLDKTPMTPHGVKDATTDPEQIRRWWTAHPDASIGIACGPSGLVVTDIDVDKGGFESWAALKETHRIPDDTLTSMTGGGGAHKLYGAPVGFQGRNSAGKLGPGLDIRANGGYIIAPPSPHPSGNDYRWANPLAEPIPLPDALRALLERKEPPPRPVRPTAMPSASSYAAAAMHGELVRLRDAVTGQRNETLYHAARSLGQLVAGGELDRSDVERRLLDGALATGLEEREARRTIRSGLDAGASQPRTTPDSRPPTAAANRPTGERPGWPETPPDEPPITTARPATAATLDLSECPPLPASAQLDPALGADASPWLDAYIDFSRKWAPGAYDGFHEAVALWVLSTVTARRVKLDFGSERYPSLYIANVARSSIWTKSTAHHIGSELLRSCGLSFLLAPDDATPEALLSRMSVPPTVTDWSSKSADQQERERLALAFAGQKGWEYDEFGSKVAAMMRDSGPMADFRGILRRLDDAPPSYTNVTVGRGMERIDRPYLALLASMPPANMAPYAKRGGALWHDGFWARFAFAAPGRGDQPPSGEYPRGERVMPRDLMTPLREWHDRLGVPDVHMTLRKSTDGKSTRDYDVTVTARPPEACILGSGVWEAFYRYYFGLRGLAAASDNTDLDANYSRFAEKALRVAILLGSLENRDAIELTHWARAQEIAERWRRSLHNLYAEINAGQDEEGQREDRVIEIVRRLVTATPADVHRYAPDISTGDAAIILERLAAAGALQFAETTRRGTKRYCVSES